MKLIDLNKNLKAGKTYFIDEGEYPNNRIHIKSSGTADLPITISCDKVVLITDKTTIRITGSHIIFSGFTFQETTANKVVKLEGEHIRFTRNIIQDIRKNNEQFVRVLGCNNRIDNNVFRDVKTAGVFVNVVAYKDKPTYCLIDNNTFSNRKEIVGKNGPAECIRLGDSKTSLFDCKSIVYNNIFTNVNGEIEIISVKSCKNLIHSNKILDSEGTITLRHGNNNKVIGNYINGNMKDKHGGIRIMGKGHLILCNTIEGIITESALRQPISIMCGDNKLYDKVEDVKILYNDFINCFEVLALGVDNKRENNIKPTGLVIKDNRIVKCDTIFSKQDNVLGCDEDCIITNNQIHRYEVKLRLMNGLNKERVNIQAFYNTEWDKSYSPDDEIEDKKEPLQEKEEEEEKKEERKYPDSKDCSNCKKEISKKQFKEQFGFCRDCIKGTPTPPPPPPPPSPITESDITENVDSKKGFIEKLNDFRSSLIVLHEQNKKRNDTIMRLINLLSN